MSPDFGQSVRKGYALLEEVMGTLLPLLVIASAAPGWISLPSVAIASLWLGFGHAALYYLDLYPVLRCRPFYRGVFAIGAGVCWPLWILTRQRS